MDGFARESKNGGEQKPASDAAIIARILAGRRDDYALLVRRYLPMVEHFLVARGLAGADLDDGVQTAFVVTYWRLGRIRDRNAFGGYLLKAARRALPRGARRTVPLPEVAVTDPPGHETDYSQVLQSAIARLPESMQVVLNLKYHEGLTAAQVAENLGQTVGSVTKTLSRAYQRLRAVPELSRLARDGELP
jgi:RNA polymerase sigma-70 factor (ECF subfamily)